MAPPLLQPRDIDLSSATLREAFTPHPDEQRITLYFLAGTMAFFGLIYLLPGWAPSTIAKRLQLVLLPWQLLLTTIHELGHALGSIILGNPPISMDVFLDTTGVTSFPTKAIGLRSFATITPSGYLGSGLYSAALCFAGFSIFAVSPAALGFPACSSRDLPEQNSRHCPDNRPDRSILARYEEQRVYPCNSVSASLCVCASDLSLVSNLLTRLQYPCPYGY